MFFHTHHISIFQKDPMSDLSPLYLNPVASKPIIFFVCHVDLVPVDKDLTYCATKSLTATSANSLQLGKEFPAELVGPVWILFWFSIL